MAVRTFLAIFGLYFDHFWAILGYIPPPYGGVYRSEGHFGAKIGQKEQYLWGKRVQNPPNRACRTKGYPLVLHLRGVKKNNFSGGKKGPFLAV